jgi:hypothetical protein
VYIISSNDNLLSWFNPIKDWLNQSCGWDLILSSYRKKAGERRGGGIQTVAAKGLKSSGRLLGKQGYVLIS